MICGLKFKWIEARVVEFNICSGLCSRDSWVVSLGIIYEFSFDRVGKDLRDQSDVIRVCCELSILFIVSQRSAYNEFCIIELGYECQITTIVVIDWLSIDSERLVYRERFSWSIDCVVLFVKSGSQNIHESLVNAWITETENESARVSLDWILLSMLRIGSCRDSDCLRLAKW